MGDGSRRPDRLRGAPDGRRVRIPANPDRGYAVGKGGALLRYGKSWMQEALPAGFGSADFTQIAFAGSQALVRRGQRPARQRRRRLERRRGRRAALLGSADAPRRLFAVAGLPDGGAVAAGEHIVIERDSAGAPWRFSDQPLPGSTVIAAAALPGRRPGARARLGRAAVCAIRQPDDLRRARPERPAAACSPAVPAAARRLRAARDGLRLARRAALRLRRLGRRPPDQVGPDARLRRRRRTAPAGRSAAGAASRTAPAAARPAATRPARRTASGSRPRRCSATETDRCAARAPRRRRSALAAGPARVAVAGHAQCERLRRPRRPGHRPDRILGATLAKVAET